VSQRLVGDIASLLVEGQLEWPAAEV